MSLALHSPFVVKKVGAVNTELTLTVGPDGDYKTKNQAFCISSILIKHSDPTVEKIVKLEVYPDGETVVLVRNEDDLNGKTDYALFPDLEVPVSGIFKLTIPALGAGKSATAFVVMGWS